LDSRRYLAAVEVVGRLVIIGVTPERVTSIASWQLGDENGARSGLSFGGLDLDNADKDMGFGAALGAAGASGAPSRGDLREPAFYRGRTEEEEAASGRVGLGLDDTGFAGGGGNDDSGLSGPGADGGFSRKGPGSPDEGK
jgi:hypothetical protein